jgi:hypothetical protein
MTVERKLIEDKRQKAIRDAEDQYLNDYKKIGHKSAADLAREQREAQIQMEMEENNGSIKMPDLQKILLD